jgi:CBS domain-containing protein
VVDGDGRPIGFVWEAQLLRARPGSKVADVMSRVALSVAEDAPASRAAAMLAAEGVECVAVVSDDGAIVGVLSALDVVSWFASPGGPLGAGGAGTPAGG